MKHAGKKQPHVVLSTAEIFEIALYDMLRETVAEIYQGECDLNTDERKRLFLLNDGLAHDIRRQALEDAILRALEDATELSVVGDRPDPTRIQRTLALADLLTIALDGLLSIVGKERLSASLRELLNSPDPDKFKWSSVLDTMYRHLGPEANGRAAEAEA